MAFGKDPKQMAENAYNAICMATLGIHFTPEQAEMLKKLIDAHTEIPCLCTQCVTSRTSSKP